MEGLRNRARERLAKGELSLGMGVRGLRGAEVALLMEGAGFDWLFIDLEHGPTTLESTAQISAAALGAGIAPLVRIPRGRFDIATRSLDAGAWGVIAPHVDSAAEAKDIVDHLRFPPMGHRSVIGGLPHFGFRPIKGSEASKQLNAETLVVALLESPAAIESADAIAAVDGIDVVMIGSNDLSTEMGIQGEFGHERMVKAYARVIEACAKHKKWPGMAGLTDNALVQKYVGMGMRMVLGGNDINLLAAASAERAKFLRGLLW